MDITQGASSPRPIQLPAARTERRRPRATVPIEVWLELHRAPRRALTAGDYVGSPTALRAIAGLAAALCNPDALREAGGSLPAALVYGPAGTGKSRLLAVLEASCPTVESFEIGAAELTGEIVRAMAEVLQTRDRPSIVAISQLEAIATVDWFWWVGE